MKKVISAIIACVFVFTMAVTAFAAVSPTAPIIETTKPTTAPTTVNADQESTTTTVPSSSTTQKTEATTAPTTTAKPDVDETTTDLGGVTSTTKNDVTSDKKPVSPDTGSYVGKSVSAAALVAIALGGAVIYTSKKKVTE